MAQVNVLDIMQPIQAFQSGRQQSQYMADRKRLLAEQENKKRIAARDDMRKIFSTISPDMPDFDQQIGMASRWFESRHPQFSGMAKEVVSMPPEERRAWAASNMKMLGVGTIQQKSETEQLTIYGPQNETRRVAVKKGEDYTPPEGWSLAKPSKGMKIYDSSGNLIVDTGGAEMTKKTTGGIESGMIADYDALGQLEEIKNVYRDDFLTYGGKAKGWYDRVKEKSGFALSEKDREFISTKKKFDQRVNKFFNAYRKLITGAAASEKELASLQKAVINTDLSPTEFQAAYDDMVQGYQRSIRINHRLMRDGVKRGTKEWGKRFDDLYITGGDDSIDVRAGELQSQYPDYTEAQISDILISEGYM